MSNVTPFSLDGPPKDACVFWAEGEELQKLIHNEGYKHLEQDEYLDADGNHCLGSRDGDRYVIVPCSGADCSHPQHASDDPDVE